VVEFDAEGAYSPFEDDIGTTYAPEPVAPLNIKRTNTTEDLSAIHHSVYDGLPQRPETPETPEVDVTPEKPNVSVTRQNSHKLGNRMKSLALGLKKWLDTEVEVPEDTLNDSLNDRMIML